MAIRRFGSWERVLLCGNCNFVSGDLGCMDIVSPFYSCLGLEKESRSSDARSAGRQVGLARARARVQRRSSL